MMLTLHTLFCLFVMAVCDCKENPICPVPIVLTSKQQQNQLEVEFLGLLETNERPPKAATKYSTKFMLDLYKVRSQYNEVGSREKRHSSLARLREDEIAKAAMSDVVVAVNCINRKSEGVGQHQKLLFLMTSIPKTARLVSAELKLYQSKKIAQNVPYDMYVISVYKAVELMKMKKVGEKITSPDFNGWLSIDISYIFKNWLRETKELQELYVAARPYGIQDEKEIHPALIGIVFQNEQLENQPFIVAFLQGANKVNARLPRNINLQSKQIDFRDILANNDKCSMHPLKISFKDLGWSDWVIAPEGYTTGFCQGACNFPLKFPVDATHHALIQSLMHLKNPNKFPNPSCSPKETSELSVLFKQKENTILKNYKSMIIRSCGCQ